MWSPAALGRAAGGHGRRLNWEFVVILLLAGLVNVPYWTNPILPLHDTLHAFEFFHFSYREFFLHGSLPRWMPYWCYGSRPDFFALVCLAPSQYLVMLAGKALGIADSLALFKAS